MRVDGGVRLVADGEPLEVIGDPGERGVAAVLHAPDHAAKLLQVLARLPAARSAQLEGVRRFARAPRRAARTAPSDRPSAASAARRAGARRGRADPRRRAVRSGGTASALRIAPARCRRQRARRRVRQAHDPRAQQRRGAQVRQRIGEIAQQRDGVLDFVGVEEAESFVDVGRDAAALERRLELAMAVARAKQDSDVRRPRRARDAGRAIAHGRAPIADATISSATASAARLHGVAGDRAIRRSGGSGSSARSASGYRRRHRPETDRFPIAERVARAPLASPRRSPRTRR